ncbi:hypothetical protein [Mucilaginibacter kameinonensis]|nr:hypothetical protein [Mucilaginibacter kameinonensis]
MKHHLSTGIISGVIALVIVSLAAISLFRRYRKFKKKYKDDFEGWI